MNRHRRGTAQGLPWQALLFGWLLVVVSVAMVTPPLQSPDESDHVFRAYLLSTGQWTLATVPDQGSGGRIDESLLAYWESLQPITFGATASGSSLPPRYPPDWSGTERFEPIPGTGYYLPLIYLPQAAGLWLGRALELGIDPSYRLARWATLLTTAGLLVLAFHWLPPNALVLGLLALPMAVFQSASAAIDGLCLALTACAIAGFLTLRSDPDKAGGTVLAVWGLILIVLVGARLNLAPLLLLPAILSLTRPRWDQALVTAITLSAVAAWVLHAAGQVVDLRTAASSVSSISRLQETLLSPTDFLQALAETLGNPAILVSYVAGFIGVLGWFNLPLAPSGYLALGSLLLVTAVVSFRWTDPALPGSARLTLLFVAGLAVMLVFLLLWLTWTSPGSRWIEGVQGRYFLPPALILAYALGTGNRDNGLSPIQHRLAITTAGSLLVITLVVTLGALLDRYHPM